MAPDRAYQSGSTAATSGDRHHSSGRSVTRSSPKARKHSCVFCSPPCSSCRKVDSEGKKPIVSAAGVASSARGKFCQKAGTAAPSAASPFPITAMGVARMPARSNVVTHATVATKRHADGPGSRHVVAARPVLATARVLVDAKTMTGRLPARRLDGHLNAVNPGTPERAPVKTPSAAPSRRLQAPRSHRDGRQRPDSGW